RWGSRASSPSPPPSRSSAAARACRRRTRPAWRRSSRTCRPAAGRRSSSSPRGSSRGSRRWDDLDVREDPLSLPPASRIFFVKLFVANWKMHKTRADARAFAEELGRELGSRAAAGEAVVAPAFPLLDAARDPQNRWSLACQNVAAEAEGAYTGEASAAMAPSAACRY